MISREKFEAFLVSEYEWGNDALNAANFHGDDATGYYTGGDFIYDGQSCSECLFWAWRGWQAAELAAEKKLTDMAVQLANAESKCRELAVENAGLKNPDNWLSQSDYGYEASEVATQNGATEDESLRAGMIAIINRIGTPATDAFLAEVRAQGLKRLAKAWYAIANETASGISISESSRLKYRQRADDVADFANKIRQEAAQ
ncbi:TPA: hypothetical protein SCR51_004898 [Citrobacter freundii]|uniref:hypothetical protein n=2 Tax=Citrobacter freundii TaxID=546 RepID=UPI001890EEBD|nr:hypothetical protein [Citrobacter freundii]HEG1884455.1 hypothetical protein [Citrobacter freundii]